MTRADELIKQAQEVADFFNNEWGPWLTVFCAATGLTRSEALLYKIVVEKMQQTQVMTRALERESSLLDRQERLMEKAEQCNCQDDEEWKRDDPR